MFKDDNGVYHYEDEGELQNLLMAGDPEATESVLNEKYVFGESNQEVVEEEVSEEDHQEVVQTEIVEEEKEVDQEETVAPVVEEDKEEDNSVEVEEVVSTFKAQIEQMKAESQAAIDELRAKLEEANKQHEQQAPAEKPEPDDDIDYGEEDPDLATDFEKNTRKLVEQIKSQSSSTPEQVELLKKLEARLDTIESDKQAAIEKEAAQKRLQALYSELGTFAKGKSPFEIPLEIGDARVEQMRFKEELAKALEIDINKTGEVERQYRKIAAEDTVWAKKRRDLLREKGIEIPEYTKNFINLLGILERKQGRKFNMYSGEYEYITDVAGNRSCLPSFDDAYKLSEFYNIVSERENSASLEIQERLSEQQQSVAVIENADTSDVGGNIDLSEADMKHLLTLDKQQLLANPDLLRQYDAMSNKLGIAMPDELKSALQGI